MIRDVGPTRVSYSAATVMTGTHPSEEDKAAYGRAYREARNTQLGKARFVARLGELPRAATSRTATAEDFDVWADVAAEWAVYAEGLADEVWPEE